MTTRERRMPDPDELFRAADAHAAGDLQAILRAAWRMLTPAQLMALFAERARSRTEPFV